MKLVCFATKGAGSNEEDRIAALLEPLSPTVIPFDRRHKLRSFGRILGEIRRTRPDLVVMEGTGLAGGIPLLLANFLWRSRFVVSSGDAVAPFIAATSPVPAALAVLYERLLYRRCAGFIGWTPYLVGRALTWGASRAMTAAGWAPYAGRDETSSSLRAALGIPDTAIVFGLAGALNWNRRVGYCYGYELVRAVARIRREDVYVLIVGDGSGKEHLVDAAGSLLGRRVFLPGAVPQPEVPDYLRTVDVLSLPQSVDGVGSFRYTTKVSEYLGAGRPVVTGQIPLAYDFDDGWLWRLPGDAPWDDRYIAALAQLMASITPADIEARAAAIPRVRPAFSLDRQRRQVVAFVRDVVGGSGGYDADEPTTSALTRDVNAEI